SDKVEDVHRKRKVQRDDAPRTGVVVVDREPGDREQQENRGDAENCRTRHAFAREPARVRERSSDRQVYDVMQIGQVERNAIEVAARLPARDVPCVAGEETSEADDEEDDGGELRISLCHYGRRPYQPSTGLG